MFFFFGFSVFNCLREPRSQSVSSIVTKQTVRLSKQLPYYAIQLANRCALFNTGEQTHETILTRLQA